MTEPLDSQRIDRWLWIARFFKTRSVAAQAVAGGKVQVDGDRVKPSRRIRPGDRLHVGRGLMEWDIVIMDLAPQRRPAKDAVNLYEETTASVARRTSEAEQRRQAAERRSRGLGRPTKRDRRDTDRLQGREG